MEETTWFMGADGFPTNEHLTEPPEKPMEKPYPHAMWRIDALYNGGLPFNMLLPGMRQYRYSQVFQNEYITVYSYLTKQDDFDNNGLAVLQPISCTITEELNGEYSLQITLPLDEVGKWTYIREMNYIKAMGQIFRICQVDFSNSGDEQQVSATALHCFYIWNDWAIEPKSRLIIERTAPGKTSMELLIKGMQRAMYRMAASPEQGVPIFTWTSDINDVDATLAMNKWGLPDTLKNVGTATELIMGSGGFIANFGGELYRDNFSFSINRHMEGVTGKSDFNIYIGRDLRGIKRKVDISTACTYLKCYDNSGEMFAISWEDSGSLGYVPHHITRRLDFEYDEPNMDRLSSDAMNYFNQHCTPLITISIDFEDVTNNSEFREFTNKPKYKVGAVGTIYDDYLGTFLEMEITKTTTDAITGKVQTVSFGASRQAGYNVNTNVVGYDIPINKTSYKPIRDIRGRRLKTHDEYRMVRKMEV